MSLLDYIGLAALVAMGLVLLTGVGGATSFGQAMFVGIAAYTTAILTTPLRLVALGHLAGRARDHGGRPAVAIGAITLRLSGHYLPLGTMAWNISFYYHHRKSRSDGKLRRHLGHPAAAGSSGFRLRRQRPGSIS